MTESAPLAPPGIFKAYDIRGLYGEEMDETTALAVGRAFARVLGRLRDKPSSELRVGLGRDMRLTALSMAAELRDGLIFEGATVVDAGMIATEMLYELVGSQDLDADTVAEIMALAQKAMRRLEEVYSPQGYNVGFNQGRIAGAGFENHIHMHVVPRWGGDTNFMPVLADTRVMPQTPQQSYEALRGGFD